MTRLQSAHDNEGPANTCTEEASCPSFVECCSRNAWPGPTLRILFCCRVSREMLRGRSSESTTPLTNPKYSGMISSQLSMMNTRRTYSLMLFSFFFWSNRSKGARLQVGGGWWVAMPGSCGRRQQQCKGKLTAQSRCSAGLQEEFYHSVKAAGACCAVRLCTRLSEDDLRHTSSADTHAWTQAEETKPWSS